MTNRRDGKRLIRSEISRLHEFQAVTIRHGFISIFYWSGETISIMETVVNGGAFCKDNELFTPKLYFLSSITLIN